MFLGSFTATTDTMEVIGGGTIDNPWRPGDEHCAFVGAHSKPDSFVNCRSY